MLTDNFLPLVAKTFKTIWQFGFRAQPIINYYLDNLRREIFRLASDMKRGLEHQVPGTDVTAAELDEEGGDDGAGERRQAVVIQEGVAPQG